MMTNANPDEAVAAGRSLEHIAELLVRYNPASDTRIAAMWSGDSRGTLPDASNDSERKIRSTQKPLMYTSPHYAF